MIKSANIMPVRTDECIAMCCENTDHTLVNADKCTAKETNTPNVRYWRSIL